MKKVLLVVITLLLCSTSAFAEATFDQIQVLIRSQDYAAAIQGLQIIIQNHPKSAKAYYAMSQAQAGVGNQAKAKEALDMATGIDPSLKFVSSGSITKLKDAIQPQTKKIEAIESHTLRNWLIVLALLGGISYFLFRKRGKDDSPKTEVKPLPYTPSPTSALPSNYSGGYSGGFSGGYSGGRSIPPRRAEAQPVHHTTVVNNSGGSDLVTGMVLGEMLAGHHNQRTVVEKEYIPVREEPAREMSVSPRSSSWDDDKPSSSSWDSPSSSNSSWDSGSSSSSWDSSSDNSSSSSWD